MIVIKNNGIKPMGMKKISKSESVISKSPSLRTGPLTYFSV